MIYADNAATTKLDIDAFEAMKPYLLNEYGNASQPYSFSRTARKALKQARIDIASCINASPEEIYFTSGGTESDNWAIIGTAFSNNSHHAVITSEIEHHAILRSCAAIERLGYPVAYLRSDRYGIIQPHELTTTITDKTKLVSVMYANNEIGSIQPIKKLCSIAHENGSYFHTDAVQAVGHINIDVKDLGVDMLSASAHKFNGPKGIGFLYIRNGIKLSPYANGGSQENGMRAGTENIASIVGMATALKKSCEGIKSSAQKLFSIESAFLRQLESLGVCYLRNGGLQRIPGNVSISIKGTSGELLLHRLDFMGICVSTGSACDSKTAQTSHVITAIGVPSEYAKGTIRVSFGNQNTESDAVIIANAISKIINSSK